MSIPTNSNTTNTDSRKLVKRVSDSTLKSSIIEFMRERPFLWNNKHPNYKDLRRREQEFQEFSIQVGCPVPEIKRVWHVLRTNFSRAHKSLFYRPHGGGENGDKLWKYYLAMEYILDSTGFDDPTKQIRQTRNSKTSKSSKSSHGELTSSKLVGGDSNSDINRIDCNSNGIISHIHLSNPPNISSPMIHSSTDIDEDHLYARSLVSTLKKFDPTTKEVIKLKFQEIIVNYMQQIQEYRSLDNK